MKEITRNSSRNSSLELLRIICMVLIITHHYSVHGGYGTFSAGDLSGGVIFIQLLSLFGRPSCSVFAIISGYFLINSRGGVIYYKRIFPLIFEMHFYSIVIWLIMLITHAVPVTFSQTVKAFFPMLWSSYWYVIFYIIMYIIAPFINSGIKALDKKQFMMLLIILLTVWSVFPTIAIGSNLWHSSYVDFFLIMYLIGAYLRLHFKNFSQYKRKFKIICILSTFLMLASVLVNDFIGYTFDIDFFIRRANLFSEFNSVIAVIWAISVFCYFNTMEFSNKIINYIAGSVVGIYLIHLNTLAFQYIWHVLYPNIDYVNFPYIHATLKIATVFIVCLVIDIVRRLTVGKLFDYYLDKYYDSIINYLKNRIYKRCRAK